MRHLVLPLALGEYLVHNPVIFSSKEDLSVLFLAESSAFVAVVLRYIAKEVKRVNCLLVLNTKEKSPNLSLIQDAVEGTICKLEITHTYIAKDETSRLERAVNNILVGRAHLCICLLDHKYSNSYESNLDGTSFCFDDALDTILDDQGVFLLVQQDRFPIRDVRTLDIVKDFKVVDAENKFTLCNWIEKACKQPGFAEIDDSKNCEKVMKYLLQACHESASYATELSGGKWQRQGIENNKKTLSELIVVYCTISLFISTKRKQTREYFLDSVKNWRCGEYISEGMRHRLQDEKWWPNGNFRNFGYQTWCSTREEFLQHEERVIAHEPKPVLDYCEIIEELLSNSSTKEFDARIPLSDLIGMYIDIWEAQNIWDPERFF